MSNLPKRIDCWKPLPNSGCDTWQNENQDNSGKLTITAFQQLPEYLTNSPNPAASGSTWLNFDPNDNESVGNQVPDSTFADLSLPWHASEKLWSSPGMSNADWSLSSKLIWQNGYSEDDVNSSVNASLPHHESTNVPPSLTQDKVFHNIWSLNSKQSASDSSPNPWDSNRQELVAPSDILTDSTETLSKDSTQRTGETYKSPNIQEKQDSSLSEAEKDVNSAADRIAELINDPSNWGKLPVDQSVPWETMPEDGPLHKSKPSTSALLNSHRHQESNVWTNEPPTGTGIWELHYEQIADRNARWSVQGRETPIGASASGSGSPQASAPQPSQPTSVTSLSQSDHETGFWGSGLSGPFQTRPSTTHIGPLGVQFRRPIFGASATSATANRLSNDPADLGLPSCSAWTPISRVSNPEESAWTSVGGRCGAHTATTGLAPSPAVMPSFFGGGGLDDTDQQTDVNSSMSMAAYRSDLVRYFMQQGFRRDDVETVLAECNMDIDRSMAVLRQRSRTAATPNVGAVGSGTGVPRLPSTAGGSRRVPPSPTTNTNTSFVHFPNGQPASAAVAPSTFGRGIPIEMWQGGLTNAGGGDLAVTPTTSRTRLCLRVVPSATPFYTGSQMQRPLVGSGANRIIPSGVGNRIAGAVSGNGGDGILGSSLSSLLGLPPPQQQENGFSPMLMRGRSYQWTPSFSPSTNPAFIASIVDLQRKRQDIQRQIQLFRSNPSMCSQPGGMALLNELTVQLHQVENQMSAREVAGVFASNPAQTQQPPVSNFWPNPEEVRSSAASLTQRFQDLRFGGSACANTNTASSSNNPPSPRSAFRATANGFRSPRHNSGTDNFSGNGASSPSGWLLVRGVPPSMSRTTLESVLGGGLLNLHPLARGNFVARFVSPDAAIDAGLQLASSAPNSSVLVNIIEERQAFDLLVEAFNATSGVVPASTPGGGSAGGSGVAAT